MSTLWNGRIHGKRGTLKNIFLEKKKRRKFKKVLWHWNVIFRSKLCTVPSGECTYKCFAVMFLKMGGWRLRWKRKRPVVLILQLPKVGFLWLCMRYFGRWKNDCLPFVQLPEWRTRANQTVIFQSGPNIADIGFSHTKMKHGLPFWYRQPNLRSHEWVENSAVLKNAAFSFVARPLWWDFQ